MDDRKLSRRQLLKAAGALGVAAAAFDPIKAFADEDQGRGSVTWDIVKLNFDVKGKPTKVTRGGSAKAVSTDNNHAPTAKITVTGHGTFPNRDKSSKDVTGGGTWEVTDTTDKACFPGHGHYRVTELLSWHPAAGTLPPSLPDKTGDKGKPSSGLAKLRVLYANGRRGTLTVSCHLPDKRTPACTFEGITASMDYEDFWQNEKPGAGEGNRTLFHVRDEGDGD